MKNNLLTFIETAVFTKKASLITDETLRTLQIELCENPEKGDVIEGTGGLRKIRVGQPESRKGKSSGYRVLYLFLKIKSKIFLIYAYPKSEKENITSEEKKVFKVLVTALKEAEKVKGE